MQQRRCKRSHNLRACTIGDEAYPAVSAAATAAGAAFLTAAFFAAFLAPRGEDFLTATFLVAAAFSALTLSHRAFVAATIRANPSLLILRLRFGAAGVEASWPGATAPLVFAHLLLWASAIFCRVAALNLLRLPAADTEVVRSAVRPERIACSSAIFWSIRARC